MHRYRSFRNRKLITFVASSLFASAFVLAPASADHESGSATKYYPGGGYVAKSSTDLDGPAYSFTDVSDGTNVTLPDDGAVEVEIGFPFDFYGKSYESIWINSNGLLSVSGELPADGGGQQRFPDWRSPNGLIAPFWTDLDPSRGGVVAYKVLGEAPSRQFVVMWKDVPQWRPSPVDPFSEPVTATFEAILFEGSTRIQFQVKSISSDAPTIPFFESNYASGIEDHWGNYGLSTRFADYSETFTESETAVEFERLISPPEPPPPPPAPIVTSYSGPFADSGASNAQKTGNLPDRHASASSSATDDGALKVSTSADSMVPTLGAYPAEGSSSAWVQVPHTFASTSTASYVTVRLRLNESKAKAARVGSIPFDPASGYSELFGVVTTDKGCDYFDYYYYGYYYDYDEDYGCRRYVRSISSHEVLGESSYHLSSPKEVELTFSVTPDSSVRNLFVALKSLSHADGAAAATSIEADAQVLGITVTEMQSPRYGCYYYYDPYEDYPVGPYSPYSCVIVYPASEEA